MDNNEIEIKISADTSDLEQSVEKVGKKIDKEADKMEKSFGSLTKTLDKVKTTLKNTFTKNNTNLSHLTTQLNNLSSFATKTATKIQSSLKKAFNVEGKVTVKEETKPAQSSSSSSGLIGDILTGSALGSKLQHGMAQMGEKVSDVLRKAIPQSLGDGFKESEGIVSAFANKMMSAIDKITSTNFDLELFDTKKLSQDLSILNLLSGMCGKAVESLREVNLEADSFDLEKAKEETKALQSMINKMKTLSEDLSIEVDLTSLENTLQALELLDRNLQEASQTGVNPKTLLVFEGVVHKINTSVSELRTNFSTMAQESNAKINILNSSLRGKLNTALKMAGNQAKLMIVQFKNFKVVKTFDNLTAKVRKFGNALTQAVAGITFKDLQKHCQNLITKFKNVGKSAKKMGTDTKRATGMMKSGFMGLASVLAPYLSIFAIFQGLKTSITSYAEGLDDSAKFATIFGDKTQDMVQWLDRVNSTVTTSKSELMDFSSNLFRMGRNMGVTTDETMKMSQKMTELGADLVAFTNDANAMDALAGALRGEYDSIQNYGYALDAASVKAKALAMGLDGASESSLLLARQTLLLEQSGDVLGYASGKAQTLSGQLAMLRKNFQALGTAIGACFGGLLQVVLPVLNSIVSAVTVTFNKLASLINSIFGIFGIKVGGAGGGGGVVGDAVGGIVDNLGGGISDAAGGAGDVADSLADGAEKAKEIASGLMGIDQLNVLSSNKDSGGSGGSGSGGSGGGGSTGGGIGSNIGNALTFDDSIATETENKASALAQKIANALRFIGDNFKIGWESTGTYVTDSITRLKEAFKSLGQSIEENLTGFAENGGDKLIQALGRVTASVTGLAISIGSSIVELVAGLVDHLNPEDNPVTRFFIDSLTKVLDATSSFAQSFGKWWDKLLDGGFGHFINVCGDVVLLVGGLLCDALATVIGWVEAFFNSWAGQAILEGVAGFIDMVATALEKLCQWLAENKEVVYAFAIGIGTVLVGAFVVAHGTIILIVAVITALVVAIGWLWENWDEIWDWVKEKVEYIGQVISTTIDYMKTTIKNKFKEIWENIKSTWEKIKTTIVTKCSEIWSNIKTKWNEIKTAIITKCSEIWTSVKTKWSEIKTAIKDKCSEIITSVKTKWNEIKTAIKTKIDEIKTNAKTKFGEIKTAIVDKFNELKAPVEKAIGKVWGAIEPIVDKLVGAFDFDWELPHIDLPHFSIKPSGWEFGDLLKGSIPSLGISWYSDGGIFPNRSLIGVGDAHNGHGNNAEAVLPLDKLWSEMNKNFKQQTETLAKMNNNGNVHITLEMDGKQVAKGVYKQQKQMTQRGEMSWDFL